MHSIPCCTKHAQEVERLNEEFERKSRAAAELHIRLGQAEARLVRAGAGTPLGLRPAAAPPIGWAPSGGGASAGEAGKTCHLDPGSVLHMAVFCFYVPFIRLDRGITCNAPEVGKCVIMCATSARGQSTRVLQQSSCSRTMHALFTRLWAGQLCVLHYSGLGRNCMIN